MLGEVRAAILPSFLHEILGNGTPWQSHDSLAVCPSLTVRVYGSFEGNAGGTGSEQTGLEGGWEWKGGAGRVVSWGPDGYPFFLGSEGQPCGRDLESLTPDVQVEVFLGAACLVQSLTGIVACVPHLCSVHLAKSKGSCQ